MAATNRSKKKRVLTRSNVLESVKANIYNQQQRLQSKLGPSTKFFDGNPKWNDSKFEFNINH